MTRMKIDDARRLLPELDELEPVLDVLLATSVPDSTRRWAGSAELSTAAERLVETEALLDAPERLARREQEHLTRVFGFVLEALRLAERGDPDAAVQALLEAARLEELRNRFAKAEAYAAAAMRVAGSGASPVVSALARRRRARAAWRSGSLPVARACYESACAVSEGVGDAEGAAEAAIGLGNVLEEQGHWIDAEAWYRRALETFDAAGAVGPQRWHALLNVHVVVRSRGALDESVPWLDEAARAVAEAGDDSARPFLANARGQLAMARGALDVAEHHFREALNASRDARATVTVRLNLAETLLGAGRALQAAEEAREAEREALLAGLFRKLPEVYRLLGRIAANEGNPDAFVLFERALEVVRARRLPPLEEAMTLQAYGRARLLAGDEAEGRDLHERAAAVYRALGLSEREDWADSFGTAHGTPADRRGEATNTPRKDDDR